MAGGRLNYSGCGVSAGMNLKSMFEPYSIKKLNLHLCKFILGVSRKSTNDAVRGELGRLPILQLTMKRYIDYAQRCYKLSDDVLVKNTLPLELKNHSDWISKIASLFTKLSACTTAPNIERILSSNSSSNVVEHFCSLYKTGWLEHINKKYNLENSNKLRSYSSYKLTFDTENYIKALDRKLRRNFSKLRISAHHLAIETGRYTRPPTPRAERICKLCPLNIVGDEKHFLLTCPKFQVERSDMFKNLSEFFNVPNKDDFQTFFTLMNYCYGGC